MSEVVDLTTPQKLFSEQQRLRAAWDGYVSIGVCSDGAEIYLQSSRHGDDYKFLIAPSFQEAIDLATQHIAACRVTRSEKTIRKLALAIIELTDEHTECTAALLRAKGFSGADIREFHEAACDRASEMCANAPFEVRGV